MSLEYALVTSSSLPNKVKDSSNYMEVGKEQWLDLVDYSNDLVNADPSQKILFLIVAKGTAEQEAADNEAQEAIAQSKQEEIEEQQRAMEEKRLLRKKSKSIFNALYGR